MITENDPLYKSIDRMMERGATTADIKRLIPGITSSEIKFVRRTRGGATEQTKRKKKRDPVEYLLSAGLIKVHHEMAADKIRRGAQLLYGDVEIKTANLETKICHVGKRPTDSKPADIRIEQQYKAWRKECIRRKIWADPILFVLTNYVTLAETDFAYNRRKGFARDNLIEGLNCYVELFGM